MDNIFFVMNENTYREFEELSYSLAYEKSDPILYMKTFLSIDVRIDNDLADDIVEVYDKNAFEKLDYMSQLSDDELKNLLNRNKDDDDDK